MSDPIPMIPWSAPVPARDALVEARAFYETMSRRRSVRHFSDRPVPRELVEHIVATAGTAPSGANKQPWRFVAVNDPAVKHEIRLAAEAEEREFYHHRASRRWLDDLRALGTDEHKEFLDVAPWLIAVFKVVKGDPTPLKGRGEGIPSRLTMRLGDPDPSPDPDEDGGQMYYVDESVGIAVGLLLTAAHLAGLATLTHTPSPMTFLARILDRPANERPFLLIPLGYPADDCRVPDIRRKGLGEILVVQAAV